MRRTTARVLQALSVTASLLALVLGAAQWHPSFAQNTNTGNPQTAAAAPTHAPSEWLSITHVSVKPEMVAEFQNFMKNTTNPALRKGGLKWRNVYQSTNVAGNPFLFVIVTPIEKFAEFDTPNVLEKALGADGYAAWLQKAGTLVNSVHRFVIRTRPDLSVQGKRTGLPKLGVVASIHVATGRNEDFENYTKNDFLPVIRQAEATYLMAQVIFGGDANEYVSLTLRESFAEIDKGPIAVQVLGQEGAQKLFQKVPAGTVTHIERSFIRFVPELSINPTAPK
jgi:hypothetical protein